MGFFSFFGGGGGGGRNCRITFVFPVIKEFEKAVALLWNWKSRKVLWYFQTGRKYVRARGLNFFICLFASILFSTHNWPKGIFNYILRRQHLRLFHKKNSFLYGRRGQTGNHFDPLSRDRLLWGWVGLRLLEHRNPAEDWARLKVSAWRWRLMISFIKNTTNVLWMFIQSSFVWGIGLWKDNGSFSYWCFSMGFGNAFTLLHNSEVR